MDLQGILTVHLEDGDVQRIVCPEPGCGVPLPRKAVRRLLDEQGMQRFDQLQLQKYIDVNPLIKWCAGHFLLPKPYAIGRGTGMSPRSSVLCIPTFTNLYTSKHHVVSYKSKHQVVSNAH